MSEIEREIFKNYNLEQLESRWKRMQWVKETERKYRIDKYGGIFDDTRLLYHNSTLAYVYGCPIASCITIASAIEAFLNDKIPPPTTLKKKKLDKFGLAEKKKTGLSELITNANQLGFVSYVLEKELHNFREFIRNNLTHPTGIDSVNMLGFKLVSYDKGVIGGSGRWESPTGQAMLPIPHEDAARQGIELFNRIVSEYLWKQYPEQMAKNKE